MKVSRNHESPTCVRSLKTGAAYLHETAHAVKPLGEWVPSFVAIVYPGFQA